MDWRKSRQYQRNNKEVSNTNFIELITQEKAYTIYEEDFMKLLHQNPRSFSTRELCQEYNHAGIQIEKRNKILKKLLGTWNPEVRIEPYFHCDCGINIHFEGAALINYNCTLLDTSPIHIGDGVMIAPGVCISCASHAIDPQQRVEGVRVSAPINIEKMVWIGANATILGGVTIGEGSVIGAGSVVTRDIPAGVVAIGNPCRVVRKISEKDQLNVPRY